MTAAPPPVTRTPEALRGHVRRSLPTLPLESIRIASPCTASWDAMTGDAKSRHCGECARTVHDLSQMTRAEAEALVSSGERVCVRLWVRKDGTVLTQDCPTGLEKVRKHLRRIGAAFGALLGALVGLVGCTPDPTPTMGEPSPPPGRAGTAATSSPSGATPVATGSGEDPVVMMGDVCEPAPVDSSRGAPSR